MKPKKGAFYVNILHVLQEKQLQHRMAAHGMAQAKASPVFAPTPPAQGPTVYISSCDRVDWVATVS